MFRLVVLACLIVAGPMAGAALAQRPAPVIEAGAEAAALFTSRGASFARGPRLVVNRDGRNALQFTATFEPLTPAGFMAMRETDLFLAAYKRVVHARRPLRVFTTIGGGVERRVVFVPETTFGGAPPTTVPASIGRELLPTVTVGGGFDLRLSRRAALVVESSLLVSDRFNGRLSGGLVVPMRSYPDDRSQAVPAPWAKLSAGDRTWVTTTDGRELAGEVLSRSATRLSLRTADGVVTIAADAVGAIDRTDPVRNGLLRGTTIGAAGAIAPALLTSYLVCALEDDQCSPAGVVQINALFVGIGAGVGAVTGALIDSLRDGRSPVYRRSTTEISVVPQVNGPGGNLRSGGNGRSRIPWSHY